MDIHAPTNEKQSLQSKCKNAHWELLQRFAKAELALAEKIGSEAPKTFGAKLLRLPETTIDKATRDRLTAARNLLAHAHISIHQEDQEWLAYWRVSDGKNGLNTQTFTKISLAAWTQSVVSDLDKLMNGA